VKRVDRDSLPRAKSINKRKLSSTSTSPTWYSFLHIHTPSLQLSYLLRLHLSSPSSAITRTHPHPRQYCYIKTTAIFQYLVRELCLSLLPLPRQTDTTISTICVTANDYYITGTKLADSIPASNSLQVRFPLFQNFHGRRLSRRVHGLWWIVSRTHHITTCTSRFANTHDLRTYPSYRNVVDHINL